MSKLEIKNLSVETAGKGVAEDISFSINGGEVHILMGPNGSGKSSLLNGIFGHPKYKIFGGEMILDGENITGLSPEKKAKKGLFLSMQYLPEIPGVTLGQFIYRAHKEVNGGNETVLELHKKLTENAKKLGIDDSLISKELNSKISGGEKKQSEILQLSALSPKFAFLDEIDSGVDVDSHKKIFSAIKELAKGGTGFLLITHNPNILDKISPDFVHIMKEGRIVKSGGHEIIKEISELGFNQFN